MHAIKIIVLRHVFFFSIIFIEIVFDAHSTIKITLMISSNWNEREELFSIGNFATLMKTVAVNWYYH